MSEDISTVTEEPITLSDEQVASLLELKEKNLVAAASAQFYVANEGAVDPSVLPLDIREHEDGTVTIIYSTGETKYKKQDEETWVLVESAFPCQRCKKVCTVGHSRIVPNFKLTELSGLEPWEEKYSLCEECWGVYQRAPVKNCPGLKICPLVRQPDAKAIELVLVADETLPEDGISLKVPARIVKELGGDAGLVRVLVTGTPSGVP